MRDTDVRQKIRDILNASPLPKGKESSNRFYKEAVKRSLTKREYWAPPPGKYKGTRLQWD
jgi:hypothetical protein